MHAHYAPLTFDIVDTLHAAGIDEREITAVVNTHLHFDHCGQNHRFAGRPVFVQAAELEAARDPMFTVAEWAAVPPSDCRSVDGDLLISDGEMHDATWLEAGRRSLARLRALRPAVVYFSHDRETHRPTAAR